MEIIDNFLSNQELSLVKRVFNSGNFAWFFSSTITGKDSTPDEDGQFTHVFFKNNYGAMSNEYNTIAHSFLIKLFTTGDGSLLRMKSNLNPRTKDHKQLGEYHTDFELDNPLYKTAIFYCNTNNGYTKFEDTGETVNSVENRMLIFDGNRKHVGYSCTDERARILINFNYFLFP